MGLEIVEADWSNPSHRDAIVVLMDEYAIGPTGGGVGLPAEVKTNLPQALAQRSNAHVVLALMDHKPAGLIIAFEGFSTFACAPLLNLHDVIVSQNYRGQGIFKLLFAKLEAIARQLGCCKLTLEVLEGNQIAQAAYQSIGFAGYELDPAMGKALFWQKKL